MIEIVPVPMSARKDTIDKNVKNISIRVNGFEPQKHFFKELQQPKKHNMRSIQNDVKSRSLLLLLLLTEVAHGLLELLATVALLCF